MCKRLSEFVAYRLSLPKTSKLIFSDFLTSESLLDVRKVYRWDFVPYGVGYWKKSDNLLALFKAGVYKLGYVV